MTNLQKMVVVKGRTVRHDGKDYGQNAVISLPAEDASRLQALGFVVSLASVRQALHDDADSEAHDGDGGESDDHNSDDADGASGDADDVGLNVTSAAVAVKNKSGGSSKGVK